MLFQDHPAAITKPMWQNERSSSNLIEKYQRKVWERKMISPSLYLSLGMPNYFFPFSSQSGNWNDHSSSSEWTCLPAPDSSWFPLAVCASIKCLFKMVSKTRSIFLICKFPSHSGKFQRESLICSPTGQYNAPAHQCSKDSSLSGYPNIFHLQTETCAGDLVS